MPRGRGCMGLKGPSLATALKHRAAELKKAQEASGDGTVNPLLYPLYAVPFPYFMSMTKCEAHQDLLAKGVLVEFKKDMGKLVFVSHQWVANAHPDPHFDQLRVLQQALKGLLAGTTPITNDPGMVLMGKIFPEVSASEFKRQPLFVWYDYFSCPQFTATVDNTDVVERLIAAVTSIPGYVEQSDFFMILAPTLPHADKEELLDYESWKDRGWCRAERVSRALKIGRQDMIIVRSATDLRATVPSDSLRFAVGTGKFTVVADIQRVAVFVEALLKNKLAYCLAAGDLHNYRYILNAQGGFLKNMDIDHIEIMNPDSEHGTSVVETFMHENGFSNAFEPHDKGWTPLHYAALGDNALLVQGLLDMRADVQARTTATCEVSQIPPKATPLHISAAVGNPRTMQQLLDRTADPEERMFGGLTPMHMCGVSDCVEGVKLLLERGAVVDRNSYVGDNTRPLEAASQHGSENVMRALLEAGHPVEGCLEQVAGLGPPGMVRILLDARADINAQTNFDNWNRLNVTYWLLGLGYYIKRNFITTTCYHLNGATPLSCALLFGNLANVEVLLEKRARVDIRNARGKTALEIATECSIPASVLTPSTEKERPVPPAAAAAATPAWTGLGHAGAFA